MIDMHKHGVVGIYESDESDLTPISLHFSEWWNGEGMTFDFKDQQHIDLHSDELQAMFTIAIAAGMVDVDRCTGDANHLLEQTEKREADLQSFILAANGGA